MRIAVRSKCQRLGIGKKIMNYLFNKYPKYLYLDVSTDNDKAVNFYKRIGLEIKNIYLSNEKVEFAEMETPPGFVSPFNSQDHPQQPLINSETLSKLGK
mmetsp:Transcript_18604/g.17702  ORF Transcript_18604/g.17702 Transcript_18604/m.17702 type:complete len:99 (+) Transcript_18604:250-546(+)